MSEPGAAMRPAPDNSGESTDPDVMPRCPRCGWQDVRPSNTRGAFDAALSAIALAPFRCRSCGNRFYRFHKHQAEA
jgi:hypothetical protein